MPKLREYERIRRELPELKLIQDSSRVALQIIKAIHVLSDEDLFGEAIHDPHMAKAARAGLLLLAGGMEDAHRIVQDLDTPEAQYWHGIVHRREPDFSNAKYWFRSLVHHPVFEQLAGERTSAALSGTLAIGSIVRNGQWDPMQFVDLCEACDAGKQPGLREELLALQNLEANHLLDFCICHAIGRVS